MVRLYNSCLNCVKMLYTLDLRKHFCKAGFWTKKKIHISTDLTRKNYLQKTVRPFHGLYVDEDEGIQIQIFSFVAFVMYIFFF